MSYPFRLLLVDDSITFLEALTYALRQCPHLVIVGCAQSGEEALDQLLHVHPDVVLMDIAMPGMNGLEAARRIKAQIQAPYVVILTLNDTPEHRAAAAAAGADGFVNKLGCDDELPVLLERFLSESAGARHGKTTWKETAVCGTRADHHLNDH